MSCERKSIKTKFFIRIVPIVVLMIIISYLLTTYVAMKFINKTTEENIKAQQEIEIQIIKNYLANTLVKAKDLAVFVENTYEYANINDYENIIEIVTEESENILGVGIWFEPYVFDKSKKYLGPYANKIDDVVSITYEYSNQLYDYFSQPYYYLAKDSNKPIFTEPFFDESSELYLISFSAPIKSKDGDFIGCTSVDIEIGQLKSHLENYNEGKNSLYIINEKGMYISNEDITLVEEKVNAFDNNNKSYTNAIEHVVSNKDGVVEYLSDLGERRIYFTSIPELDWIIVFEVYIDDITRPIQLLTRFYFIVSIITLSVIVVAIVITVNRSIHKPINELIKEFDDVGRNEYSVDISDEFIMNNDEFGLLGQSFGNMKVKLKSHQSDLYKQMKEIEYLSYCDQLTGLRNRRYADQMLKKLIEDKAFPISIIVADLNGLKLINDAFGHNKGDELLNDFATVLMQTNINKDYLSKTGGDEFMVYLPYTQEAEGRRYIDKINAECKEKSINGIALTASLGICTLYKESDDFKEIIKTAEDDMYRNKIYGAASRRKNTVELIINTLHKKSIVEKNHSERVAIISEKFAKVLKFSTEEVERVRMAGLLHDIGKIGIIDEILNKEMKLTESEYIEMCKHPEIGYRILKAVGNMNDISEIVFAHHERWDGAGYPRQLKGEGIPVESRMVFIADAYDSMTTDRNYKAKISKDEAKVELIKNAGSQFDKELVEVFIDKVLIDIE